MILAEISPGELIDKITVLELKIERIDGLEKLRNVEYELGKLWVARGEQMPDSEELTQLALELKSVNARLWDAVTDIQQCGAAGDFGPEFNRATWQSYIENNKRSALKKRIDRLCGSAMTEEKSYL